MEKLVRIDAAGGYGIMTRAPINKDEVIFSFEKHFVPASTNVTLHVDDGVFQLSTDPTAIENFLNHSCDPNAYIDFVSLQLHALRPIEAGEEITYHYGTSDWDDEDVFDCECGSKNCLGHIAGFRNMPKEVQDRLLPYATPYIKKQFRYVAARGDDGRYVRGA